MGAHLKVVEDSFKRKQVHDLSKCITMLSRESKKAIDTLSRLCDSEDPKIASNAATALLDVLQKMTAQKDQDQVTRLIAQLKLIGRGGSTEGGEDDDDMPLVDFQNIQDA